MSSPCDDKEDDKFIEATMKRHPKFDCNRAELLKMLSYMEGELQARDVVIAALKSERLKQLIYATKQKSKLLSDPYAALFRDDLAVNGNLVSNESSLAAASVEQDAKSFANQQLEHLHRVVNNQRHFLVKLTKLHTETKDNYMKLLEEFESEKRKHEKSDPEGETEKAKLRQMMFEEKNERKKAEDELQRVQALLEAERAKQKQMVLFLLNDRKQLLVKYSEERKRSEDLAQILSEEKQRVDTIAEGLEEESKKSLRMEADLEKQAEAFEVERRELRGSLAEREKVCKEQELLIVQLRAECEALRKEEATSAVISPPMMSAVAKVVQPTATVSSVPVSGPTTGVARSIVSGQQLRANSATLDGAAAASSGFATTKPAGPRKTPTISQSQGAVAGVLPQQATNIATINPPNAALKLSSTVGGGGGGGGSPGGKKSTTNHPLGRGVPPPIPPNKPVIPPKREGSSSRLVTGATNGGGGSKEAPPGGGEAAATTEVVAAASSTSTAAAAATTTSNE